MSESKLTRRACKELAEDYGAQVLPIVAGKMGGAGWPDRYIAHQTWKGFVEFKVGRNQLTPLQRNRIVELRRVGQPVAIVRWFDDDINRELHGVIEGIDGVFLQEFVGVFEMLHALAEVSK